jgi:hypothetical protein
MSQPNAPLRGSVLRADGAGGWGVLSFLVRCTKRLIFSGAFTQTRTWIWPDRSDTVAGLAAQTFTGVQTISDTTDSTAVGNGSFVTAGGASVAKKLRVDDAIVTSKGFQYGATAVGANWNEQILIITTGSVEPKITLGGSSGFRWSIKQKAPDDSGEFSIRYEEGGIEPLIIDRQGVVTLAGAAPGTPSAGQVLVGGGEMKTAGVLTAGIIATSFTGNVIAGVQSGAADTAGAVGETLSSTVSGVAAAASGSVKDATSVSVTRGKWMPRASVVINAGATGLTLASTVKVSIVSTSATNGTSGSTMVQQTVPVLLANGLWSLSINIPDINISSAATYYLTVEITYAAGSPTIDGSLIFTRSR